MLDDPAAAVAGWTLVKVGTLTTSMVTVGCSELPQKSMTVGANVNTPV